MKYKVKVTSVLPRLRFALTDKVLVEGLSEILHIAAQSDDPRAYWMNL